MAYAPRNDRFGGGFKGKSKFGSAPHGRSFSDRGGVKTEMHPATCSDCGTHCEVPFRPNGKKPVLCKSCFSGGDDFKPKFASRDEERRPMGGDNTAEQLRSMNAKLDTILKILKKDAFVL